MGTASTSLSIEILQETEPGSWDEYILKHPQGTPFHLTAWKKTIQDSFGYKARYLSVVEGSRLRGVLPLFEVKNAIIGHALISTPFAVYGGILADGADARRMLYDRARQLGEELGVDYIEFRNASPEQCEGTPNVSRYVAFSRGLVHGAEATLQALPSRVRNKVRKALKQPFEMRYAVRDLTNFEDLYARSMRRLGTPCFPKRYFENLVRNYGDMVDVREVWLEGKPMAASLNFLFRGDMHIYYAAADTRFNSLAPNTYMYFDHLRWAGENGYESFDFGRCKRETGVFEFKRHWDTTMRELPYEVVLVKRKELPNFSPTNPKFGIAIKAWQRMPVGLTRLLGPKLIRFFP